VYDVRPNTIIGFHGCDLDIRTKLVNHPNQIEISKKPYDWLGHGMYFWENNYTRAMEWAENKAADGTFKKPAVLGAVLQIGHCCDFPDSKFTNMIAVYHRARAAEYDNAGKKLPENLDAKDDDHKDKLIRKLDCSTIQFMHEAIEKQYKEDMAAQGYSEYPVFDSTRGVFTEGGPAFTGAGIERKSHIQICIRNMNCIKGFFIPREEISFP
jgi:hypothetical protein